MRASQASRIEPEFVGAFEPGDDFTRGGVVQFRIGVAQALP